MKIIKGSLLQSDVPVIVHQCNCFHKFGSGIALQLKNKYPECYERDLQTKFGDKYKLGTFNYVKTKDNKLIFNLYSQYRYGRQKRVYTDYQALEQGITQILYYCCQNNINRIGIPYLIGCGSANGNIEIVMQILQKAQKEIPQVQIQIYKLGE